MRRNLAAEAGVVAVGEGGGEVGHPPGVEVTAETAVAVAAMVDRAVEVEAEEEGGEVEGVVVVEGRGAETVGGAAGAGAVEGAVEGEVEGRTRRGFSRGERRRTRQPWATTTAKTRPVRRRRRACSEC